MKTYRTKSDTWPAVYDHENDTFTLSLRAKFPVGFTAHHSGNRKDVVLTVDDSAAIVTDAGIIHYAKQCAGKHTVRIIDHDEHCSFVTVEQSGGTDFNITQMSADDILALDQAVHAAALAIKRSRK